MENSIRAEDVIDLVPDHLLDTIAMETGIDYSVKKLQGKNIFKLFLFGVLNGRKLSLRILAEIFKSNKFKQLFDVQSDNIKHSAIGMRLSKIDYRYFERIFEHLVASEKVGVVSLGDKRIDVRKIDSTIVVLSSKLLKVGIENASKHMIKYSVEINSGMPAKVLIYKDQRYVSEDNALPPLINRKIANKSRNIAIFDRGIQCKKTLADLVKNKTLFISRLTEQRYRVVSDLPLEKTKSETLKIVSYQLIKFENTREKFPQELRLIIGVNKKTKQKISFITNVDFLSAIEITELYKSRWEIETFFKFIKQELNFSHYLSRTENGIKVVAYLTLIAAILLTLYKKINKIEGWIPAKIRFMDQLDQYIMREWQEQFLSAYNVGIARPAYV